MTKATVKGPLTIIGLGVDNFMKVTAVSLKPDGSLLEICGDNGNGKSSLLNAIWVALGGAEAFPENPVRDGQQEAVITLDMGEIVITRTFRRHDDKSPPFTTTLRIEAASGARFDKPQTLLDGLVGQLSFEPMAFLDLPDKEKFDRLRVFVPGVDFDAIEGQNKTDYERRTDENRRHKELLAQAAGLLVPAGSHVAVDVSALLAELEEGEARNRLVAARRQRRQQAEKDVEIAERAIERIQTQIAALQSDLDANRKLVADTETKLANADPLPDEIDTAAIREKIGKADAQNKLARDAAAKAEMETKAEAHKQAADALTEAMDARRDAVRAKIAAAEMPVPGLSLEDGGRILLNGHPFADASTAEKLKTSIAVAMAMNPTVRVIRITKGGNDLDKKSMKIVADMAAERGYQVWVEVLEAKNGPPCIIMENGHAKGTE